MNIGVIIQARTGSTRFPEKILKPLPYNSQITVLEQVVRRIKKSIYNPKVIIATTINSEDDIIEKLANKNKYFSFRGSENDVLSRYYYASKENKLDIIVRVTSDCPCIDSEIIDEAIRLKMSTKCDYVSNIKLRTYPRGLDVEVFDFNILEEAFLKADQSFEREHVTPYMYDPVNKFKINSIEAKGKYYRPDIRITLDTNEDYMFLVALYEELYEQNNYFGIDDIINLLENKPWLGFINNEIEQKIIYTSKKEELVEASKLLNTKGMYYSKGIIDNEVNVNE
jgi:spore coat polysaccharide biosynthesis protein SpsF